MIIVRIRKISRGQKRNAFISHRGYKQLAYSFCSHKMMLIDQRLFITSQLFERLGNVVSTPLATPQATVRVVMTTACELNLIGATAHNWHIIGERNASLSLWYKPFEYLTIPFSLRLLIVSSNFTPFVCFVDSARFLQH